LMSLLPLRQLPHVRPVAAADYFLQGRLVSWFSRHLIGIIPLLRNADGQSFDERLAGVYEALERRDILILFPEGSRGEPERLSRLKSGIAYIAQRYPEVPTMPIFLHGFGKALPKGEALLVPFFCDVFIGEPMAHYEDPATFMQALEERMQKLAAEGDFPPWE
jgi:1-acyl-sn-glycerol-3-phosphate acyltransferase